MEDLGFFPVNGAVRAQWGTQDYAGASITRATNGTIRVYKDGSTTERTSSSGIFDTEDWDGLTGVHQLSIDLSDNADAGFWADGSQYVVTIAGMVIDGQTINVPLFKFRIGTQSANVTQWLGTAAATPTTAGVPEVDVTFWRGQAVPSTLQTGVPITDVGYWQGNSPVIGVNGVPFVDVGRWAGDVVATPSVAGVPEVDLTHVAGSTTNVSTLATNADTLVTRLGAPSNLGGGATIAANLVDIESQTDDIGVAGASLTEAGGTGDHLTAVPWNSAWDAEVQSEVDDALKALGLDHLVSASVAGADVADNSIVAKLASKSATADWDSYDNTTDALEALADQLASLPTAGPGPWGVVINVKSGGVNIQNADVTATNGSESYHDATNSSGNATFSLPTDDWDFYVYKPNYVQDDPPYEKSVTTHSLSGNNVTLTYDPPGQELTEEDPTMTATFLTLYDGMAHLRDVLGGTEADANNRLFRRACRFAFDEYFAEDGWKESLLAGRIEVQATYSTGTIAFDLTGGSSERLITLTSGTFPSWAARGTITIDNEHYRVTSRLSSTTLQLDETFCPTADVAAGTSYTLWQDSYLLPADFTAIYEPVDKGAWDRCYISEEDWLRYTTEARVGGDFRFTIMHDDRQPGRFSAKFYGYPTEAKSLTFLYKRKRKTPVLDGLEANSYVGTIAYTNGSATITGTSTAFSDSMVGAVLRIGDASNVPTDNDGSYPPLEEHIIAAVASTTSLTLKTAVGLTTGSGKKYRVSDPLCLDRNNRVALLKGCEYQYHTLANSSVDNVRDALAAYRESLTRAQEQQSKHRDTTSAIYGSTRPSEGYTVNAGSLE